MAILYLLIGLLLFGFLLVYTILAALAVWGLQPRSRFVGFAVSLAATGLAFWLLMNVRLPGLRD